MRKELVLNYNRVSNKGKHAICLTDFQMSYCWAPLHCQGSSKRPLVPTRLTHSKWRPGNELIPKVAVTPG